MTKLVEDWLNKAEEDYRAAQKLYESSAEEFTNSICFHAQQSLEKYLKAILVSKEVEPPRTHDLDELLDLAETVYPQIEQYRPDLDIFSAFAVEYRYPGVSATIEEAEEAYRRLVRLRDNFRSILGL